MWLSLSSVNPRVASFLVVCANSAFEANAAILSFKGTTGLYGIERLDCESVSKETMVQLQRHLY
jgi:hypothetical protein